MRTARAAAHNRAVQAAHWLGPCGRRARALLSAWSLTSGSRSSVSPPSLTAVLPPLRRPLTGSTAPARAHQHRANPATPKLPPTDALPLSLHLNRANGGRPRRSPRTGHDDSVEREPVGPGGPGRSGDHGAHITTAGEAVERLGDGGRAVGLMLRLRRGCSGDPVGAQ